MTLSKSTEEEIEKILDDNTSTEWGEDYSYAYFDQEAAIPQILLLITKEVEKERERIVVIGQKRRERIGDEEFNKTEMGVYNYILSELADPVDEDKV